MDVRRPRVAILGTRFEDFDVETEILGDVELVSGPGASSEEILFIAGGADVILAGAAPRFDAGTLDVLGAKAIVRLGVGFDSVDVEHARSLGMWVVNVPDYGTEAVALHAVTLILGSIRRLTTAHDRLRRGVWGVAELRPLRQPSSMTVGIVGFGRIGQRVASMLAGVGFADFLVCDPVTTKDDVVARLTGSRADLVPLPELMARSDVVTLHSPPPEDGHLIGIGELAAMNEGSVLVNTARGALVETDALIRALAENRPGFAALDVFENEPPDVALFESVIDRVTLTPHMSWYTEESELALRRQAAAEARRILVGEEPLNPVVAPMTAQVR